MAFPIVSLDRYRPIVKTVATTDPAANVEISQTVPAGQFWQILGARVALVTDANVANRTVALTIDDGTTVVNSYVSPSTQAASLTYNYNFVAGGVNVTTLGTDVGVQVGPNLILPAGYRIKTVTTNRQVTDNFGVMTIFVIAWIK